MQQQTVDGAPKERQVQRKPTERASWPANRATPSPNGRFALASSRDFVTPDIGKQPAVAYELAGLRTMLVAIVTTAARSERWAGTTSVVLSFAILPN